VAAGTLTGSGPGKSAKGRLGALNNMLGAAASFIGSGETTKACGQLREAYNRTDGQGRSPDFATGMAALELAEQIQKLMRTFECP